MREMWLSRFRTVWILIGVFAFGYVVKAFVFEAETANDVQIVPSNINLGVHSEGTVVEKMFIVRNSLPYEAKFDEIVSGCGCLSLWDEKGSSAKPLDRSNFVVRANSERMVVAKLDLQGVSGNVDRAFVIRSKDIRLRPLSGRITGFVEERIRISPAQVHLGEIPMEGKSFSFDVSHIVGGKNVLVLQGDACFPMFSDAKISLGYKKHSATNGTVEGYLTPIAEGSFCKFVEIKFSDGTPAVKVKVFGKAVPAVLVSQSFIHLPRVSEKGKVFSTQLTCRAAFGKTLKVDFSNIPDELKVSWDSNENSNSLLVNFDCSAMKQSVDTVLKLQCTIDDRFFFFDLPFSAEID